MASSRCSTDGGDDPAARAQRLKDHVDFGLGLAARAQALPHEGHSIQPQHIHALVGQKQHDLDDFQKHLRVGPVQIPLVFVERGPDPFAESGGNG
jgi:hypothetical protein